MRRADRLFSLVQLIRGKQFTTAHLLASRLEVSLRTIYRDVADLQKQGVPIEGEAGVGYRMGAHFDLPPLMFTHDEARAMAAASRIAQQWLDPALALAMQGAMSRILSVLPASMRVEMERMPVYAQLQGLRKEEASNLQALREAAQRMQLVALTYQDADQQPTERIVSPLGCFYWGKVWTLAAWCDLRHDFRSFRIDRISHLQVLDTHFQHRTGRTLQDMLRQQSCRPVSA